MPNSDSAQKTLRASGRKRIFNLRRKEAMKRAAKSVGKLVSGEKHAEAEALLPQAYKAIDKAAKRGVIKKNTAARKKARLARLVRTTA